MNREWAKNILPLIQAFADGATIQYRYVDSDWADTGAPTFSQGVDYRIKPGPKECWVAMTDGYMAVWKEDPKLYAAKKFREVIE